MSRVLAPAAWTSASADGVLQKATTAWFVTTMIGQWAFLYYIVTFYGPSISTGDFKAWVRNPNLLTGYVAGDVAGNLFFATHVVLAAIITLGGALQLVPWLRTRAARFHRWNGRLFMAVASAISLDGLYLVWVRRSSTDPIGAIAITGNAALITGFVVLAWRTVLARDLAAHRRWALRSYMVANGQWFFRIGVFGVMLVARPALKPFFVFWTFGCYLVPLAMLEIYLRARDNAPPAGRLAVASGLVMLAILTGVGTIGVYLKAWRPLL